MADGGGGEKQLLGNFVKSQTRYGTTTKPVKKSVNYVKHSVSKSDTLMGLALRYGVTAEQIKRENKLWTNDSLFLREFLFIPISRENSHLVTDDWEIVTGDSLRSRTNSDALTASTEKSRSDSDTNGVSPKIDSGYHDSSAVNATKESALDFLNKYDSNIAKLKTNVEELEKNSRVASSSYADNLAYLPRRHSESSSRNSAHMQREFVSLDDPNSPVLVIRSRTQSHTVKSSLQKSEQANEELFQL